MPWLRKVRNNPTPTGDDCPHERFHTQYSFLDQPSMPAAHRQADPRRCGSSPTGHLPYSLKCVSALGYFQGEAPIEKANPDWDRGGDCLLGFHAEVADNLRGQFPASVHHKQSPAHGVAVLRPGGVLPEQSEHSGLPQILGADPFGVRLQWLFIPCNRRDS